MCQPSSAFEQEWKPRWTKHDNIIPETWDTIMGFIQTAIPKRARTHFPPITKELWRKTVAKKKKYSAVGPGGVSKKDMQNLPDACLDDLLDLLLKVEQGERWPNQVTTGLVAALAKTPAAQTTNQYRPANMCFHFHLQGVGLDQSQAMPQIPSGSSSKHIFGKHSRQKPEAALVPHPRVHRILYAYAQQKNLPAVWSML